VGGRRTVLRKMINAPTAAKILTAMVMRAMRTEVRGGAERIRESSMSVS
jgi:hypothetical protein